MINCIDNIDDNVLFSFVFQVSHYAVYTEIIVIVSWVENLNFTTLVLLHLPQDYWLYNIDDITCTTYLRAMKISLRMCMTRVWYFQAKLRIDE